MGTCFSIMPFDENFNDIDAIIEEAAGMCGLEYVRGDRRAQPGSIMPKILQEIRRASVIVADITGHNPNVFYELGIAHQLRGPDRVVIITQDMEKSPFDVHAFEQLGYKQNEKGRAALREKLCSYLKAAIVTQSDEEIWNVMRGSLKRTRRIVQDLEGLLASAAQKPLHATIRVVATFGSLAISDHEAADARAGMEYQIEILRERKALRDLLLRGAQLKGVLNPPRRYAVPEARDRLQPRFKRLLGLLAGKSDIHDDPQAAADDVQAIKQCEFVLNSVSRPNLYILGEEVAYEGMKRGGAAGFEMTHRETDPNALRSLIEGFDRLFNESRHEMKRTHPPDGRLVEQLQSIYDEAHRTGERSG